MADNDDECHWIMVGRCGAMTDVLAMIEEGNANDFSDGEIVDAIQAAAQATIDEYVEDLEELDPSDLEWLQ